MRNLYPEPRFVASVIWAGGCMWCASRPFRAASASSVSARRIEERLVDMANHLPLTNEEGEVRELTAEDFARARPAAEALPEILGPEVAAELLKRRPGQRGAQKPPLKKSLTVRYSAEVIAYFRATGPGWQSRMDEALRE